MINYEKKVYSQNGEDGIIAEIFNRIGTTNKFYVEFGVQEGTECNTRLLKEQGWQGIWFDSRWQSSDVINKFLTVSNINETFAECKVPETFDFLSIDIDGQDFYIWQALQYKPRAVIIEYNGALPLKEIRVVQEDEEFIWDGTSYIGASLESYVELGRQKGYTLIYTEKRGVNAFFVKSEYADLFPDKMIREIPADAVKDLCHRPPFYYEDTRPWINPFCKQ